MFGHMNAHSILAIDRNFASHPVEALLNFTDDARPVRWIEFPTAILVLVAVPGDADSGAL